MAALIGSRSRWRARFSAGALFATGKIPPSQLLLVLRGFYSFRERPRFRGLLLLGVALSVAVFAGGSVGGFLFL